MAFHTQMDATLRQAGLAPASVLYFVVDEARFVDDYERATSYFRSDVTIRRDTEHNQQPSDCFATANKESPAAPKCEDISTVNAAKSKKASATIPKWLKLGKKTS